jgi:hypothetical protein
MANSGAGGSTPTTVNAVVLDRGAGDKATAAEMSGGPRSPAHSTEGGNYKYIEPWTGWGGNVQRD